MNTTSSNSENIIVVYPKEYLDQIIKLLDNLKLDGNTVHNAKLVTAVVQILETKGTAQTIQKPTQDVPPQDDVNPPEVETADNVEVINAG